MWYCLQQLWTHIKNNSFINLIIFSPPYLAPQSHSEHEGTIFPGHPVNLHRPSLLDADSPLAKLLRLDWMQSAEAWHIQHAGHRLESICCCVRTSMVLAPNSSRCVRNVLVKVFVRKCRSQLLGGGPSMRSFRYSSLVNQLAPELVEVCGYAVLNSDGFTHCPLGSTRTLAFKHSYFAHEFGCCIGIGPGSDNRGPVGGQISAGDATTVSTTDVERHSGQRNATLPALAHHVPLHPFNGDTFTSSSYCTAPKPAVIGQQDEIDSYNKEAEGQAFSQWLSTISYNISLCLF